MGEIQGHFGMPMVRFYPGDKLCKTSFNSLATLALEKLKIKKHKGLI